MRWARARLRGGRAPVAALGATLLADALDHALAPVALEFGVQVADTGEDLVRHRLLLLARGFGHAVEHHRLAVLHGHLRELETLPVARLLGAVDGDRHDRRAGLQRNSSDPPLGLVRQLARARAPALAVHDDAPAPREDR